MNEPSTEDPVPQRSAAERRTQPALADLPRVLADCGRDGGPLLVTIGGLHGNEHAGVRASRRLAAVLDADPFALVGRWVALAGNRPALAVGQRYVDEDLNRIWAPDRVAELRAGRAPASVEESELVELDRHLCELLDNAPGRVTFLDLHSTSGPGPPFATVDDTLLNREFARSFPVPRVLGFEEELWARSRTS